MSSSSHIPVARTQSLSDRVSLLESKHRSELDSLNLRVQHLLEKKELAIAQLKRELEDREMRLRELEQMMDAQLH